MWTTENRRRYERDRLRYPSDLTDLEWEQIEPLIPPAKRGGGKRTVNMREVVNGVMYVLSTGCQWRYAGCFASGNGKIQGGPASIHTASMPAS